MINGPLRTYNWCYIVNPRPIMNICDDYLELRRPVGSRDESFYIDHE